MCWRLFATRMRHAGSDAFIIIGVAYPLRFGALIMLAFGLLSCTPGSPAGTLSVPTHTLTATAPPPTATASPTARPSSTHTPAPTPTATPRSTRTPPPTPRPPTWDTLAPGVGVAEVPIPLPEVDGAAFNAYVVRIDPARTTFRVFWDGQARTIGDWRGFTGADIVVNGGFFTSDYRPMGRLVMEGELVGTPFDPEERLGVPGLFAVLDGEPAIYSFGRSTFTPRGLRFDEAIEGYPMLLLPGRQPVYPFVPANPDRRARRTVIGLDGDGRVLIILIDGAVLSLYELSQWLAESNLNLDTALNLDGGRSSGMVVALGAERTVIPAYVELPIVLAVYAGQ